MNMIMMIIMIVSLLIIMPSTRYSNEFLESDRVANVYFTSDVDVKSRISGLNEFYRINLNDVRRAGAHDDRVFSF